MAARLEAAFFVVDDWLVGFEGATSSSTAMHPLRDGARARVADVIRETEPVQDVAGGCQQLALLTFVAHAAAARNASTVWRQRGTTWSGCVRRNVTPEVSVA